MPDATYPSTPTYTPSHLAIKAYDGITIKRHLTQDASCSELTYAGGWVGVNRGAGALSGCPDTSGTEVKLAIEGVWEYPAGDLTAMVNGTRLFFDRPNQAITTDSTHWWFADVIDASIIPTHGRFKFKFRVNQGEQPSYLEP